MGLTPIEQNYNFLDLTRGTRGIGAVGTYRPYEGGAVAGGGGEAAPARAVDRLPKAQMVSYEENLAPQAGYERGLSTKTLWA